ncbi:MAG: hypothetical protein A4E65_00784 [Syntrophorhabdus sp. PtaU1.Bin153]|nr:MAG: hypothetical protein A4E65_00784 [Syntrophorhabdus sp. PtaU1.Bin153]
MSEEMVVSRKAIIEYLRQPLSLPMNLAYAWRKIRRWKKRYNMRKLFHYLPNGQPYILISEFELWLFEFERNHKATREG